MKIILTEGCTNYGMTIDGRDYNDLSLPERRELMRYIAEHGGTSWFYETIAEYMHCAGESKDLGVCDDCGDTIIEYSYIFPSNADHRKQRGRTAPNRALTGIDAAAIVEIADKMMETAREQHWSKRVYYDAVAKMFNQMEDKIKKL